MGKFFQKQTADKAEIHGPVERCSAQYTSSYGAFLMLLSNDDRIFSIGPDQYIHPAIHLTKPGDHVIIEAYEDLSCATTDNMTVWTVKKFVNITLENRLGRPVPRWKSLKDEARLNHIPGKL